MKVNSNTYEQSYVIHDSNSIRNQKNDYVQPNLEDAKANEMIDGAVSLKISKRGLSMAGELQEFDDMYETRRTLTSGIGSHELIDGGYIDILSKNYQDELNKLKEQYSGTLYEEQLEHLNKTYDEATDMVSRNYVKQLRILTGDIELKSKSVTSYSYEEDAITALSKEDNKTNRKQYVIDTEQAEKVSFDIKNMLLHMKNGQNQDFFSEFLSYNDIKNIGIMLLNKNAYSDTTHFSKYAQSIVERYNEIQ